MRANPKLSCCRSSWRNEDTMFTELGWLTSNHARMSEGWEREGWTPPPTAIHLLCNKLGKCFTEVCSFVPVGIYSWLSLSGYYSHWRNKKLPFVTLTAAFTYLRPAVQSSIFNHFHVFRSHLVNKRVKPTVYLSWVVWASTEVGGPAGGDRHGVFIEGCCDDKRGLPPQHGGGC